MRNIRLTVAYDGTDFAGWQVQPDARTVQGELERAVAELTGETVRVLSAGRTDAGVHALAQVANFRTESAIPAEKWRPALQGVLPSDIAVRESTEVPLDFHATYSAVSKRYRYLLRTAVVDDPFLRRYAWRLSANLDVPAMAAAAQALLGTHDFRCFETEWPNKATSVRTVLDVDVRRLGRWNAWTPAPLPEATASPDTGEFIAFEIEADGFLYNMVRSIVGTLVNVGRGKWPADALARAIESQDRSQAGETAPARGLYLVRVKYFDAAPEPSLTP